jgi:predicted nucleotidyltransferase
MYNRAMNLYQVRKFAPQIRAIAQKYGVSEVYVFGSVARGGSKTPHDVDFLIDMLPGTSLFGTAGFLYETEKLLGVPVDVVPRSALPLVKDQSFINNVQREAILL